MGHNRNNDNISEIEKIFFKNIDSIKYSHTNVYSIWNNYIIEKKTSLIESMKQFNKMYHSIKNMNDLTKEQIIILYEIMKSTRN